MTRSLSMWHAHKPFNMKAGRGQIESVADGFGFS